MLVWRPQRRAPTRTRGGLGWLGRKDSNLQPSDPESAALPLRHSPSARTRGRANHSKEAPGPGRYSLVMTTSGFLAEPSVRTVIRIETGSGEPINLRYASSIKVLARSRL